MSEKSWDKYKSTRKAYYERNKLAIIAKSKETNALMVARNTEYINNYLKDKSCIDCGYSNPLALDFDHVIGTKKDNVSSLRVAGYSLNTIIEEIAKCEIRCANCHRIITKLRRVSN